MNTENEINITDIGQYFTPFKDCKQFLPISGTNLDTVLQVPIRVRMRGELIPATVYLDSDLEEPENWLSPIETPLGPTELLRKFDGSNKWYEKSPLVMGISLILPQEAKDYLEYLKTLLVEVILGNKNYYYAHKITVEEIEQRLFEANYPNYYLDCSFNQEGEDRIILLPFDLDRIRGVKMRFIEREIRSQI